ncbi:MAG: HYR domain-containing protein, partial [Reichenbachiella sp.]
MKSLTATYFNRLYITILLSLVFSLSSYGQNAPGGVSTDLQLWLKTDTLSYKYQDDVSTAIVDCANLSPATPEGLCDTSWPKKDFPAYDGSPFYRWYDLSSNDRLMNRHSGRAKGATFYNNSDSSINYLPVADFQYTSGDLSNGFRLMNDFIWFNNSVNIFVVVKPEVSPASDDRKYVFDYGSYPSEGIGGYYSSHNVGIYSPSNHGGSEVSANHSFGDDVVIINYELKLGASGEMIVRINNQQVLQQNTSVAQISANEITEGSAYDTSTGPFSIGRQSLRYNLSDGGGRCFDGQMVEFIVYDRNITDDEREKIHTYLAIKNGVSLSGDYKASDNSIFWNTDATYNQGIAGIGRDDQYNLNVKQAKSSIDDAILTIGLGQIDTTIVDYLYQPLNTNEFASDLSYLVWSNDGGTLTETSSELSDNILTRLSREWKLQQTGNIDNLSVQFDLNSVSSLSSSSKSDLILLISADSDFSTGTITRYEAGSFAGNIVKFDNVNFDNGMFMTLGTSRPTMLGTDQSASLWLKGDAGTSTIIDGAVVSNWIDQSGSGHDAVQPLVSDQPFYSSSLMNFNPSIKFTSNDFLVGNAGVNNEELFVVVNRNSSSQAPIGFEADGGATPRKSGLSFPNGANHTGLLTDEYIMYYLSGGTYVSGYSAASSSLDDFAIVNLSENAGGTSEDIFYQGLQVNNDGGGSFTTISNSRYTIGAFNDTSKFFTGNVAEVISFDEALTSGEKSKVHSYLATKYGITLGNTSTPLNYNASDGSVYWTAQAGYQNNIAGIGRDDNYGLNQKQSISQHEGATVTIGLGSVEEGNASNNNSFANDLTFLAWGNDDGSLTEITTELPGNVESRLEREWKVSNINGVGELAIQFDTTGLGINSDHINLIIDEDGDGDFETGNIYDYVADSIANGTVYYNGVTLAHDVVFTLSTAWVKPASITDAVVWLKAESNAYIGYDNQMSGKTLATHNDPVLSWKDISGRRKYDAVTDYKIPAYYKSDSAESINFRPALYFPGDSTGFTFYDDYVYGENDGITTFAVVAGEDAVSAGEGVKRGRPAVFDMGKHGNRGYGGTWGYDTAFIYSANATDANQAYANPGLGNSNTLVKYEFEYSGNNTLYANDIELVQKPNFVSTLSATEIWENPTHETNKGPYTIGRQAKEGRLFDATSGPRLFKGYMAEFIQFDRLLTDLETQKVQSYLGMKYGLPLGSPSNPFTYVFSDGSTVWTGNTTYQNNIFGIYRDDVAGVEQRQATSSGSGGIHAMGHGQIAQNNDLNPNAISNDLSSLFIGNDAAALVEVAAELPDSIHNRIDREWLVQKNETIGAVDLAFDLSAITVSGTSKDDFRLLIDSDGDGNFTTGTISYVIPESYLGGVVLFDDVNFSDGDIFSIATQMNTSPYVTSSEVVIVDFEDTYSYSITSTDREADGITIISPTLPDWLIFTDNADGTASLEGIPDCSEVGTHRVVLKMADYELDSTHTFDILVGGTDTTDPVIVSIPTDITQDTDSSSGDAVVTWTVPTTTDNCSATLTTSHTPGATFALGTTTVTYTATDGAINVVTSSFDVIVEDNEDPTITC